MKAVNLSHDVVPLSRFRSELADTVRRVRTAKRPVLITQNGESSVVVVDVDEYQALLDEIEVVREMAAAERELDAGLGISAEQARAELHAELSR